MASRPPTIEPRPSLDDQFPFLGVGTSDGWDDWFQFGVEPSGDGRRLLTDSVPTYRDPTAILGGDDGIRVVDVAIDDCGLAYVLDESGDIYRYDPDRGSIRRLSCRWQGDPPGEPRALCVTDDDIYVASVVHGTDAGAPTVSGRVHVLSRHLLATRWFATEPFVRPRRVVATDDAVYVLDDGADDGSANPHGFLARLHADGTAVVLLEGLDATDVTVDDAGRLALLDTGADGPAIEVYEPQPSDDATGDGSGSGDSDATDALVELAAERVPSEAFDIAVGVDVEPTCLAVGAPTHAVVGVGSAFVGERLLYRYVARDGAFERLPSFSRSCTRLVLSPARRSSSAGDDAPSDGGDGDRTADAASETPRRLYAVEAQSRTLYLLQQATRNRTSLGGVGPHSGRLVGRLDAGENRTVWHRVTTDVHLGGPGTQLQLRYVATDDPDLDLEGFQSVPDIGPTFAERLGSANVLGVAGLAALDTATVSAITGAPTSRTTPWVEAARDRVQLWGPVDGSTPRDVLLEDAVGRYLWVELTLLGEEFDSPRVDTVRAYFPRRSYLRYLPAIYQENEASAAFLERFLSLFESSYVDVEEAIAGFTRYLEPAAVPEEYLTWLGGWLATAQDESWPTEARRALLAAAPALFRRRGTEAGLRRVLDLLLADVTPPTRDWETARAHEVALLEEWVDAGYLTEDERTAMLESYDELVASDLDGQSPLYLVWTHALFDCLDPDATDLLTLYRRLVACPQCFIVLTRPVLTDAERETVQRVVETWAPAHATGRAAALRPGIRLDANSFLGVNTTLTEPSFVLGESLLGTDTVLGQRDPTAQLGLSHFGRDARMS